MARCLTLESSSVQQADNACLATLEGSGLESVEWFEGILCSAFPSSGFRRTGKPSDSGFLGMSKTLVLRGGLPAGGAQEVEEFLFWLTRALTIEDSLDESHSLGYHQEEDETGGLIRSQLGCLVWSAKYGRPPDADARDSIVEALCMFVEGHPRYRRAGAVAAVPPHEAGRKTSLCQSIVRRVAARLGIKSVEIRRVSTRLPQKDIVDEDRQKGVERRIANQEGSMRVEDDVTGASVIAIDDLYGSGASMLEAARALRDARAKEVVGLTVTKQHLYEGVRLATLD